MSPAPSPAARPLVWACLAVAAALAFWGVLRTGATTSDDLYYEQNVITGRLGELTTELATGAGRFHHYLHVTLTALPYFLDAEPVRKGIALAVFLAALISFAVVAARLTATPTLAPLAALWAVVFYQDNWHHNILTAYPLVFDSGLLCLTWAAYCLWRQGRGGGRRLLVAANLLAFAAYCHFEAFICYAPALCALIWLTGRGTVRQRLRTMAAANISLVVYLIIYFVYRALHPSQYDGNSLDLSQPLAIFNAILTYSQSGLPLGALHLNIEYINRFPTLTTALVLDPWHYFAQLAANWWRLAPAWIGLALLTGGLTWHLLTTAADRPRPRLLGALALLYAAYCPNFLIALSPKYREPIGHGITWYVTSTFSAYAWAVLLALAGLWLCGLWRDRPGARRAVAGGIAFLAATTALINASVNTSVLDSKIAAASRWRAATLAAESPAFAALPDGAVLVAPDLFAAVNVELPRDGYWEAWFVHHTGKHLHVVPALDQEQLSCVPVYNLRRLSPPTARVTSIALARIARTGEPDAAPYAARPDAPALLADRVDLVSDATNCFEDAIFEDSGTWKVVPANAAGRRGLAETTLTGQAIPVTSIALVPAGRLAPYAPSPWRLRFGPGFSAPERAITGPVVWAGDSGEISLINRTGAVRTVRLEATLIAMTPVRLHFEGPELSREIASSGLSTPLELDITLPPGISHLTVRAVPPTGAPKRFGLLGARLAPRP